MWECDQCGAENDLDPDTEEGQIIECLECGCEFEVTELEPLTYEALAGQMDDSDGADSADASEDDDDDDNELDPD